MNKIKNYVIVIIFERSYCISLVNKLRGRIELVDSFFGSVDEDDINDVIIKIIREEIKIKHTLKEMIVLYQGRDVIYKNIDSNTRPKKNDLENILELEIRSIKRIDIKSYNIVSKIISKDKDSYRLNCILIPRSIDTIFDKLEKETGVFVSGRYVFSTIIDEISNKFSKKNLVIELEGIYLILRFDNKRVVDSIIVSDDDVDENFRDFLNNIDTKQVCIGSREGIESIIKEVNNNYRLYSRKLYLLLKNGMSIYSKKNRILDGLIIVGCILSLIIFLSGMFVSHKNYTLKDECIKNIDNRRDEVYKNQIPKVRGYRSLYGICVDKVIDVFNIDGIYIEKFKNNGNKAVCEAIIPKKDNIGNVLEKLKDRKIDVRSIEVVKRNKTEIDSLVGTKLVGIEEKAVPNINRLLTTNSIMKEEGFKGLFTSYADTNTVNKENKESSNTEDGVSEDKNREKNLENAKTSNLGNDVYIEVYMLIIEFKI